MVRFSVVLVHSVTALDTGMQRQDIAYIQWLVVYRCQLCCHCKNKI